MFINSISYNFNSSVDMIDMNGMVSRHFSKASNITLILMEYCSRINLSLIRLKHLLMILKFNNFNVYK